jgi:hypothetical protein
LYSTKTNLFYPIYNLPRKNDSSSIRNDNILYENEDSWICKVYTRNYIQQEFKNIESFLQKLLFCNFIILTLLPVPYYMRHRDRKKYKKVQEKQKHTSTTITSIKTLKINLSYLCSSKRMKKPSSGKISYWCLMTN